MRKLSYLILFALLGIGLVFTSCEDDEEVKKSNQFKFKIDGEQKDWSSTAKIDYVAVLGLTNIVAYEGKDTVRISLAQQSTGVFTDENEGDDNFFTNGIEFANGTVKHNSLYSDEGFEIEITKFEDEASTVEGSFSGTCATIGIINEQDSVLITEGEFYVNK